MTVRRRFSSQLFVRGSYTYAISIDESSNTGGTISYNFSQAQDSRNLKLERGRSDFDIGHTFAGSFTILDGPGAIIINTSLSRRIRFAESRSFQFRLEVFNLPNHPNFNLPENNVDIATGGTINRAKNNRNLQIGLRLEF